MLPPHPARWLRCDLHLIRTAEFDACGIRISALKFLLMRSPGRPPADSGPREAARIVVESQPTIPLPSTTRR